MAQVAVCSQINTKHKYSVGRMYSCWMLNCWCITWPVGFKRLTMHVCHSITVDIVTLRNREMALIIKWPRHVHTFFYDIMPYDCSVNLFQWLILNKIRPVSITHENWKTTTCHQHILLSWDDWCFILGCRDKEILWFFPVTLRESYTHLNLLVNL